MLVNVFHKGTLTTVSRWVFKCQYFLIVNLQWVESGQFCWSVSDISSPSGHLVISVRGHHVIILVTVLIVHGRMSGRLLVSCTHKTDTTDKHTAIQSDNIHASISSFCPSLLTWFNDTVILQWLDCLGYTTNLDFCICVNLCLKPLKINWL